MKAIKRNILAIITIALFTTAFGISNAPKALADLMILPIRTVFQDRDRMRGITLVNTSPEEAIFRIEFYNQIQTENGAYIISHDRSQNKEAIENNPWDLSKMLSFSPRQIQLPPRGKQIVRLSVRRSEGLPDGEYRTHLKLRRINQARPTQEEGENIEIVMNVGFSVPIILRKGKYDSTASVSEFKYTPSPDGNKNPSIDLALTRDGKYSTLGKITIFWVAPNGQEKQVGIKNNVNIFPEINKRTLSIPLSEKGISGGKFRVVYEGSDADKGKKFDEKTFPVGG